MAADGVTRIAMWSGPRNISTAMMRAWENRADCQVVDEPFYAHYLRETGIDHPGRDAVIASQATNWRSVAAQLTGPVAAGTRVFYQKHMAHHFLPGMEGDWLDALTHAFLIRDPAEMVASYAKSRAEVSAADLGLHRQVEIWRRVARDADCPPPVIDGRDVLENPEGMLRALCDALALPFDSAMLAWPAGPRDTDGVWAPYWYASVERSTGFLPYRPKPLDLKAGQQAVVDACRDAYEFLWQRRITTAKNG
jgi:hypothetical protein